MRIVLGAIVGYALWTALWLGGQAAVGATWPEVQRAFDEGGAYTATAPLLVSLLLSVVCSLVSGAAAAAVGRESRGAAVLVMAVLLLGTGIGVQAAVWERMPLWYHLSFLALLLPASMIGARLSPAPPRRTAPA